MLNVIIDNQEIDLREIPLDSRVAILTGTFDPAHMGHINIGEESLQQGNAGNYGELDYFFFVPHSSSPGKAPIPLNIRILILRALVGNSHNPKMGILFGDGVEHCSSVTNLFSILSAYIGEQNHLSYIRVIGADRIDHAVVEHLDVQHIVFSRDGSRLMASDTPANFYVLEMDFNRGLSSTLLRTGQVPFGSEYKPVMKYVREYYPNGI